MLSNWNWELLDDGDAERWMQEYCMRCPSCNNATERISGCFHMECKCGEQFCWRCNQKWSNNHKCSTQYKKEYIWNNKKEQDSLRRVYYRNQYLAEERTKNETLRTLLFHIEQLYNPASSNQVLENVKAAFELTNEVNHIIDAYKTVRIAFSIIMYNYIYQYYTSDTLAGVRMNNLCKQIRKNLNFFIDYNSSLTSISNADIFMQHLEYYVQAIKFLLARVQRCY